MTLYTIRLTFNINHHNTISQKVTRYLEKSPSPPTCNPLQEQVSLLQLNFSTFPPLLPVQIQPSSLTYQIFRIYYHASHVLPHTTTRMTLSGCPVACVLPSCLSPFNKHPLDLEGRPIPCNSVGCLVMCSPVCL